MELRLRLHLGPGADRDLAGFPIGAVPDIDSREPALPRLLPVQATLARVTPRRHHYQQSDFSLVLLRWWHESGSQRCTIPILINSTTKHP